MKKSFIFLHLPKTGGTSVKKYLTNLDIIIMKKTFGLIPKISLFEVKLYKKYIRKHIGKFFKHIHMYEGGGIAGHKKYSSFILKNENMKILPKVIIIRKPYDWYLSYLTYFLSKTNLIRKIDNYLNVFKENNSPIYDQFYDIYGKEYYNIEKIENLSSEAALYLFKNIRIPYLIKKQCNYKININEPMKIDFMTAMYCWFMYEHQPQNINSFSRYMLEKISPEFKIARTEHLEEDLKKILASLGYKEDILSVGNFPKENALPKGKVYERIKEEIDNSEIFRKELEGAEKTYKILRAHV